MRRAHRLIGALAGAALLGSLYPGEYALTGPESDLFTARSTIEVWSNSSSKGL